MLTAVISLMQTHASLQTNTAVKYTALTPYMLVTLYPSPPLMNIPPGRVDDLTPN